MRSIIMGLAAAGLMGSPAEARDWRDQGHAFQPSAFAGARIKLPLGGKDLRPSAGLAIAPARTSVTPNGMPGTMIGEGLGLNLIGQKPQLTIAGRPASKVVKAGSKQGISTVGWVAIGVGTVAVAALAVAVSMSGCETLFNDEVCDE